MKWFLGLICFSVVALILVFFTFGDAILVKAGNFMAPMTDQSECVVDAVILDGTGVIGRGLVSKGFEMLSSGKVKHVIIVLHNIAKNHWPFAFDEDYPSSVSKKLRSLGVSDSVFTVIVIPIRHPVTLASAKGAIKFLAARSIKSAIIVSSGFHTRRTYLAYKHLAEPFNIKIYPMAHLDRYLYDNWWYQENGLRDFISEIQKLIVYFLKGYIPLKLLWS